jgi:hypothetical protein
MYSCSTEWVGDGIVWYKTPYKTPTRWLPKNVYLLLIEKDDDQKAKKTWPKAKK